MTASLVLGQPIPVPGSGAELGESPVWDPRTERLRWVDMLVGVLHDTDVATGDDVATDVPGVCGFVGLARDGLVVGVGSEVLIVGSDGTRVLVNTTADERLRLNDTQVAPDGSLVGGLMGIERRDRDGTGSLLRVTSRGQVSTITEGITLTNGIGWSPDGSSMYHVDMPLRRIDRYDYDVATGEAANRRAAFAIGQFDGMADGMAVDSEGRLWIAFWGTPVVRCFSPAGEELDRVELPVANVTSCAFGGEDLSTLFVTTARWAATAEQPDAGAVFAVPTGATGQPARFFGAS